MMHGPKREMHEGTIVVPLRVQEEPLGKGPEDLLIPCLQWLRAWSLESDSPGSNPDSITYEIYALDYLLLCVKVTSLKNGGIRGIKCELK